MSLCQPRIVIIGAGLQGTAVALALAARGIASTLLERQPQPFLAASLRNEGKIHLGFVYALSAGAATGEAMLRGATSFARLLDRWCGPLPWRQWRSEPFRYVVMPDSLLTANQLATAYGRLTELAGRVAGDDPRDYLGEPLTWLWQRAADDAVSLGMAQPLPVFETAERSVDPRLLAAALRQRLAESQLVTLRCQTSVRTAARRGNRFQLVTQAGETVSADAVINCSWEDRRRLDGLVGVAAEPVAMSYRVKHQILVRPRQPLNLRPVTMVQGPFGDLVPWSDGSVYLSWYPTGRTYIGETPPPKPLENPTVARRVAEDSLAVMTELFPALSGAEILTSRPGIIVARGRGDVDQPGSGLHQREAIGVSSHDNWWTIDTGKLTTAPWFAAQAAEEVADALECTGTDRADSPAQGRPLAAGD